MQHPQEHPLFAAAFANWLARAEALSALPDAPVVPDPPRRPGLLRRVSTWLTRLAALRSDHTDRREVLVQSPAAGVRHDQPRQVRPIAGVDV